MININLDHQSLTPESAAQLIIHLEGQEIDHLSLFSNHFGDIGISLLAQSLSVTKIRRLSLAYNSIKLEGAIQLSKIIKKNNTIKYLDLDENLIETDGINILLNDLEFNHNLVNLSLAGNPGLTALNHERLKTLLNRNKSIWKQRNRKMGELVDVGRKLISISLSLELKLEILQRMYPDDFTRRDIRAIMIILDKNRIFDLNKSDKFEADVFIRECIYLRQNGRVLSKEVQYGMFNSCAKLISKGNNFVFSSLNLEMKDDFDLQRAIYSPVEAVGSALSDSVGALSTTLSNTYKNTQDLATSWLWNNRFFTEDEDSDDLELNPI